jgi:hypothetical protein
LLTRLYIEYRVRKEKEGVDFKKHVIQVQLPRRRIIHSSQSHHHHHHHHHEPIVKSSSCTSYSLTRRAISC